MCRMFVLWITYAECRYAECHYAECHYTECRYADCRYADCRYAKCRDTELCHTIFVTLSYQLFLAVSIFFPFTPRVFTH
jgi:hypothetical protein